MSEIDHRKFDYFVIMTYSIVVSNQFDLVFNSQQKLKLEKDTPILAASSYLAVYYLQEHGVSEDKRFFLILLSLLELVPLSKLLTKCNLQ